MTKFNLLVNPFTYKILISARINKVSCEVVVYWGGELQDWWGAYRMEDKIYEIHLTYVDELEINIYELSNSCDTSLYNNPSPTSIKLTSKDQF